MLTDKEEAFIKDWAVKREQPMLNIRQFLKGLSSGLVIGIGIILLLVTGWYERAVMEANSQFNPVLLLLIVVLIGIFMGYFYQQYRSEMNEQLYQELLHKKRKSANQIPENP